MKPLLLIIDDDIEFAGELTFLLESGYATSVAHNSNDGLIKIKTQHPDIVLLDLMLGSENGLEVLKTIKSIESDLPVIMITEYASVDTAVEAMKLGAENYISKTPNLDELKIIIERAIIQKLNRSKVKLLEEELYKPYSRIVGKSKAIQEIKQIVELFAQNNNTVLITGESGTGKELVARQIHKLSNKKNGLFVAINCAALPETLIESELFGHEQGAFTGAIKKKIGKFELASPGTIFLDEIAELKLQAQVKLMRVLQEKEFERVGGNKTLRTDARIIAATNRDLKKLVEEKKFREDLFYRLDVLPVYIPPLRERKEDIPELLDYLIQLISYEMNIKPPGYNNKVKELFLEYDWPGNIREMINYITRAIILGKGNEITPDLLNIPKSFQMNKLTIDFEGLPLKWVELNRLRKKVAQEAIKKIEAEFVSRLLKKFDGNITKAAEFSEVHRTNLHKIIKRTGLITK